MIESRIAELESIGLGLERDGRIHLADHNSLWGEEFSKEADRILHALNTSTIKLFHIGSTSIPAIRAKPIIDILMTTHSLDFLDTNLEVFTQMGYEPKGEFGLEGRRYFVLNDLRTNRTYVHIHAWEEDHPQVLWHLVFRDYLRHHPVRAKEYEALKTDAVEHQRADRSKYSELKAPLIEKILFEAKFWAFSPEAKALCSSDWRVDCCPPLETERMILEPVTEDHAKELCELFSDPELHRFVPFEVPTLEEQRERCVRWSKRQSPEGGELWLNWAGRDKTSRKVMAHFQAGVKRDRVASIGYVVAREFQSKGLAQEGVATVLKILRGVLDVQEVKAWCDSRNLASHRLAQKLGMTQIEFIKDADFFKGTSSDEFVFSRIFRND